MQHLCAHPAGPLRGDIRVPGDKSISHRALILGTMAVGETAITGLLEGEDVRATAAALGQLGAHIERQGPGRWTVQGVGVGGCLEPEDVLDLGNSGTAVRLLIGLTAGHDFSTTFTGDASLRRRPMARIMTPLQQMGARFQARDGDRLPITVAGAGTVLPIEYRLPVASAQVKSAVLLAGLNSPGITTVIEPEATRDHTEHMLRHFGMAVDVTDSEDGRRVAILGQQELTPQTVKVPGDPSSAAFAIVAALLVPDSDMLIRDVGLNPLRTGLFDSLREMGADIVERNRRLEQGEPVADLAVRASSLTGITVPPARAPSMIDEYPVLAVAAAAARGATVMRGIAEMRVKESDRIASTVAGLRALGVTVDEFDDGMTVHGVGGPLPAVSDGVIATDMDHRIAMSFLVYGMAAQAPVTIDDASMIDTSFPDFRALMNGLGADLRAGELSA